MSPEKTMSPSQIAANQANGRRSMGPATVQGRWNSRFSNLRHGFYIPSFEESMAALGEDEAEFKRLEQDLLDYWLPAGAFRENLVRRLARALWRGDRGDKAESGQTLRQLEAVQAGCDSSARQLESQAEPLLCDLEYLLDCVRRRDFGEGDEFMFAANRVRARRNTGRLRRVHELLFEPDVGAEGLEDEDEAEESGPGGEAKTDEAGEPDGEALTAAEESACAEAEALLRDELRAAAAAVESRNQQAVPSPAEWSARLAPMSPMLMRWQDSLGREAQRLIKLLSDLETRDQRRAAVAKRKSGQPRHSSRGRKLSLGGRK